jgi:rhodanese-related sulfurtransferase
MSFGTIQPRELIAKRAAGEVLALVDVRTAGEYASGHAEGACSIPLSQISAEAVRAKRPPEAVGPTYIICQSGGRSRQACRRLMEVGLEDVVNVEGGTAAWRAAGLPMEPSVGSQPAGLPGWMRGLGLLLVLVCLILSWQGQAWFAFVALGIWVLLLIGGRGACPLNSCAMPRPSQREERS